MAAYIGRRLITALIVIIIVSLLVFLVIRILPGDPVLIYLSRTEVNNLTPQEIERVRHEFGLDKPMAIQYVNWIGQVVRGNLGQSLYQQEDVAKLMAQRLPITLNLSVLSFLLSGIIGITFGLICALRRGKAIDSTLTTIAIFGITIPTFWLAIMLIYLFGLKWQVLPLYGYVSPFTDFGANIKHIILPVFCMAIFPIASVTRQTRSSTLEVTRQDYIRTAWAKGLRERVIVIRHILKNGLIPVITLMGMSLSFILGGAVIIETVFSIPGMGRLSVDAVFSKDYPIIQAIILITATMVVLVNLGVDLLYGWLDPRIRYS
jgi:peptide/nickel transport system permease protein